MVKVPSNKQSAYHSQGVFVEGGHSYLQPLLKDEAQGSKGEISHSLGEKVACGFCSWPCSEADSALICRDACRKWKQAAGISLVTFS